MKIRAVFGFVIIAALVTGCGFQPLYGNKTGGDGGSALSAVSIALIEDRNGQILRNFLIDRLQPNGSSQYSLQTTLVVTEQDLGTALDSTTTRSRIIANASFALSGPDGYRVSFFSRSAGSYITTESDYATLVAREDAIRRALRDIADEAKIRLASFIGRT